MTQRFRERSMKNIKEAKFKAEKVKREGLLRGQARQVVEPRSEQSTRIITQYSKESEKIRGILRKYWSIVDTDEKVSKAAGPHPLMTFKRNRSLKDRLSRN